MVLQDGHFQRGRLTRKITIQSKSLNLILIGISTSKLLGCLLHLKKEEAEAPSHLFLHARDLNPSFRCKGFFIIIITEGLRLSKPLGTCVTGFAFCLSD